MYNKTKELLLPEVKPTKPTTPTKKKRAKAKPKYKWEEWLATAKEIKGFTANDIERAGRWTTCAVGELFGTGWMHNQRIYNLGCRFDNAVTTDDVSLAQRIWDTLKAIKEKADVPRR